MSGDVQQIKPEDDEIAEQWERLTDDGILSVGAFRVADDPDCWVVSIWAQELFGQDPVGIELRQRIQSALRAVEGVSDVQEHDNEHWDVIGTASGEAVIRAAASVVDDMADRLLEAS